MNTVNLEQKMEEKAECDCGVHLHIITGKQNTLFHIMRENAFL